MESIAGFFKTIVLSFFLMGVFVALAPRFFFQMGQRQGGGVNTELERENEMLRNALTETRLAKQELVAAIETEHTLRVQAEQRIQEADDLIRQKEQQVALLTRRLEDSSAHLASLRSDFRATREEMLRLGNDYQLAIDKIASLVEDSLVRAKTIASLEEQVASYQSLATAISRLGFMTSRFVIPLILAVAIFLLVKRRNQHRATLKKDRSILRPLFSRQQGIAS
jgi:DNA repair exonuclease SbcCD ATPase subunit